MDRITAMNVFVRVVEAGTSGIRMMPTLEVECLLSGDHPRSCYVSIGSSA